MCVDVWVCICTCMYMYIIIISMLYCYSNKPSFPDGGRVGSAAADIYCLHCAGPRARICVRMCVYICVYIQNMPSFVTSLDPPPPLIWFDLTI